MGLGYLWAREWLSLDLVSEALVLDLNWVNCGFWLSVRGQCEAATL